MSGHYGQKHHLSEGMQYSLQKLQKLLKPGDVILVHGNHVVSKIIRIITQSYWNHAVMYIGKNQVIQSDKGGVVLTLLAEFTKKDIAIYRHKKANAEKIKKVLQRVMKKKGSGYDISGLIQLGLLLFAGMRGNIRQIGVKNQYICSELVADAYQYAGIPLTKYPPDLTSPSDIDISSYLRRL